MMNDADPEVLSYERSERRPKPPLDPYCHAAGWAALFSLIPLVGIGAIVLAVIGLRRYKRRGHRGGYVAGFAIAFGVIGLLISTKVIIGLPAARAAAVQMQCSANLRQIGQHLMMYRDAHPRETFTLADVAASVPGGLPKCSQVSASVGTSIVGSYVLLPQSRMRHSGREQSELILIFELTPHHIPTDGEFPESNGINVLFGDGHVEFLPVEKAAELISNQLRPQEASPSASQRQSDP